MLYSIQRTADKVLKCLNDLIKKQNWHRLVEWRDDDESHALMTLTSGD